ncbi:DNA polymerase I [Thiohalobacter sp. COW1]|uniref:DNA polymerase I n=1 Tax=Thiohalobacter sp. COW1 TaxID=2795687 RepID=UPI001915B787|nr:DNA polymerase I [Thiohalobacter sp. COW1]BCO32272.1 DNA polymerase I [Thiohalobacter sp. COW1]
MPSTKPVVLVDGSSYLYRAFHALPPLTNSRGEPTGAVYGVVNMLKRLLKDYQPEHVAVVFDARGKTFRDEMFEHYKANRPPMPEELAAQIEPLHALVRALGFPVLQVPGVEADDVIGTLARQADARGEPVLISTGDKDMAQLVEGGITLVNTMSNTTLDRAGVVEKFGVPPERIVDYLALVGDSSDNIPGVPKVGPKTAAKWLNEYGSLDALIEQAESVKGKVGESLRENLAQLDLSRQLATIRCDLELKQDVDALAMQPPDRAALKALYEQMEFRTWLKEILGSDEPAQASAATAPPAAEVDYETVLTQTQLDAWLKELEQADHFAFDTETTSLEYMQAEIVGLSFAVETHRAAYVPLAHDYAGAPEQLDRDRVLKQFKKLLEDKAPKKIGHNLKYDMSVLANHGIELRGIAFDTMLESYVLDSTASRHDMDSLALKYLAHKCTGYEEVAGKGAKQLSFNEVPVETAAPYAAEDADITLRLHQTLWPRLQQERALVSVFSDIDLPLVPVLSRMERNGVKVDRDMLATQSGELAHKMAEIEEAAFEEAGQPFNIGSPKQIQEILFDQQGLPVLAKTPKGAPSTAESVLAELALDYRLPRLILDYRSLSKLKSTYTDKLPERIDARTGRVHTSYHQAVAATGRLSSTEPNLQNIPVRTESGRRIRQAFIAEQGYRILAADYSQIELRIMAHLSGDEGLLAAFAAGEDIHRATAAEVFGAQPDQVTSEQRRSAKAINFGLIYGMSAFGLAKQLGIERGAAQEYVDLYFTRYPGVKAYMDRTREQAHDQGYVETLFGRRLYLPEINARNHQRRTAAERTAINAPMQGTAADIIKLAMISTDAWIRSGGLDLRMVMQVHDELVFEVAAGDVEAAQAAIRERMQTAAELAIPLEVEVGVGANWDEAH